ncbi:MAG: phospho-sugar mutase [Actinobacteria bacterium]|nr:phospho-sugar mutase [Actinomycetota bacterium]MBI3687910.1 phospho-sugar mutase [Actinomycetota bacterium]
MTSSLRARAEEWLAEDPDPDTRAELRGLLDAGDWPAIEQRFAGRLEFGTAGLRGPLGAGPTRMNRAVVRRTAAGLAAYLRGIGARGPVVIGYDARHKSVDFAHDSAAVLAGAGFDVRVLPRPLPTPVLAFAVRRLAACAGVMVTASHNPPADNGYKVYLGGAASPGGVAGDGAQIVPPADGDIEAAIGAVRSLADVPLSPAWHTLGEEVLEAYLDAVAAVPRTPHRELRIAATALHGVGGAVLSAALRRAGFAEPAVVAEQAEPDPDFPTVRFPNPEEPGAVDLLLALADRVGADLAIANDPDADRCAVAVDGRLLRGDELGVLLADHLMRHGVTGTYATTVVSSSLLAAMCAHHGLPYAETLTGFKWIARAAADLAFGYEEAHGYAVAPESVRDKDGISAALLVADLAASLRAEGKTLLDRLDELALRHGLHATDQLAVRVDDLSLITAAMRRLRADLPRELLGEPVTEVTDRLPAANVLTARGRHCRVVVRPSGTEPKLKAYLEVVIPVTGTVAEARTVAADRLAQLRAETATALGLADPAPAGQARGTAP